MCLQPRLHQNAKWSLPAKLRPQRDSDLLRLHLPEQLLQKLPWRVPHNPNLLHKLGVLHPDRTVRVQGRLHPQPEQPMRTSPDLPVKREDCQL